MPDDQLPNLKVGQPRGSESPTYPGIHPGERRPVVILEGVAAAVTGAGRLQAFLDAYNPKYDWDAAATDEGATDSAGAAGPAYRVRPRVVIGWDVDMRAPTRWSFTDSTMSLTPERLDPVPFPDARRHQFSAAAQADTPSRAHPSLSADPAANLTAANVERHSKPLNIAGPPL